MIQLKRWTTWNFKFQETVNSVPTNLNGYKVFFTIKKINDTDVTDAAAAVKDYALIAEDVTYKTFSVTAENSRIDPGIYVQGFRWITPSGDTELTSDLEFEVLATSTNRDTPPE